MVTNVYIMHKVRQLRQITLNVYDKHPNVLQLDKDTVYPLSYHRLYTPYGCETAARACRFVVEPTAAHCLYPRFALLKFSFVNDSNARQFLS